MLGLLPEADLEALARLSRIQHVGRNEPVFHKSDEASVMLLVLSGHVLISSTSPEGKEVVLNLINPGEMFGEISLLDGRERTADATAIEPADILVVERRNVLPLLERNPSLCIAMIALLCSRLRATSAQVEDVTFLDLRARLAKKLYGFAQVYGQRSESTDGIARARIGLRLTQRELGAMMGTSREAVNKQLRAWIEEGLLAVERGVITILDLDAFAEEMEEDE